MLTDRFIRNAKPGLYADEGGLYLQVYASGNKAFLLRTRVGGTQKKEVLGHYPKMGLAEAREKLERLRRGGDRLTVKEAWDDYYAHLAKEYDEPEQTKRMIEKDILPGIEDTMLDTIDKAKWMDHINRPKKRGSPKMSNRLLTQTKKFLDYAEDQGWVTANPLTRVRAKNVGGKEVPKDRNLSWDEIVDFYKLLMSDTHRTSAGTRVALHLCLLTGLRASEVLGLKITGEPFMTGICKKTRAGTLTYKVPLTPEIRAAMKLFDKHPRPGDHRVLSQALRDLGQTFTPHSLRHTLSTRFGDLKIPPHVGEKVLNHVMQGSMAVYNHAEYWEERVSAMRVWGAKLRKLRQQAKKSRES